jgi:hypothetical protein
MPWLLASHSPAVRWQGHDTDHSLPSSAEVPNQCTYKSTPVSIHGANMENFTFYIIMLQKLELQKNTDI